MVGDGGREARLDGEKPSNTELGLLDEGVEVELISFEWPCTAAEPKVADLLCFLGVAGWSSLAPLPLEGLSPRRRCSAVMLEVDEVVRRGLGCSGNGESCLATGLPSSASGAITHSSTRGEETECNMWLKMNMGDTPNRRVG